MSEQTTGKVKCIICGAIFDASEKICPICGVGEEHFVPAEEGTAKNRPSENDTPNRRRGEERFVILGSGIAAVAAAEEIRRIHSRASIVMTTEEKAMPYYRPALSKNAFTSRAGERFSLHTPAWYSEQGIFILFGRTITRILPRAKQLELSDGAILEYDKCIIATGARSAEPPIEGRALRGVFSLRSLDDFESLAQYIRPDMRAVVVGGGALGLEAAWQLYLGGCHVTVLEAADQLFPGRLSEEISERIICQAAQREVAIRTGATISRLEGKEHVRRVILPGEYINAELVLLCCGSRARTELAQEAGLEADRGILVNSRMMTAKYGIYACGDCAQIGQDVCGMWNTAENMGRFAGRNAAGEDAMYHPRPTPLLMDAFGMRLFAAGDCSAGDDRSYHTEHRESPEGEQYLYYRADKLCGAVLLGDISQASALLSRIESGRTLSMI